MQRTLLQAPVLGKGVGSHATIRGAPQTETGAVRVTKGLAVLVADPCHDAKLGSRCNPPGRVVRRVEHERFGLGGVGQHGTELLLIDREPWRLQRDHLGDGTRQAHCAQHERVERLEENNLVARVKERQERRCKALLPACGDHNLCRWIVGGGVSSLVEFGDGFAEGEEACEIEGEEACSCES